MSLLESIDFRIAICTITIAYCVYRLSKPLSGRFLYSTNLDGLPGPKFEGHFIAEPFLSGATQKPMTLIEEYGPVFTLKRRFAVCPDTNACCAAYSVAHSDPFS
jgi:hypothetical protein